MDLPSNSHCFSAFVLASAFAKDDPLARLLAP